MAEEFEIDQEVYDQLIAEGKSERVAKAKAKAAAARKARAAEPQEEAAAPAKEPAAAAAGAGAAPAAARAGTGVLTPEERQARVQEALAAKGGNGGPRPGGDTRYQDQPHTHRLLAMVPPSGIQQIRSRQEDKVYVWPHLLSAEFIALMVVTVFLAVFAAFVQAPLLELANPGVTPNPSKAPWYFMGLQELLRYFHPSVAGVTIPTVGILVGFALPYIDKNPSIKPENRKTAIMLFTFAMVFNALLVIVGSFFRGPGFNWVWPWVDGLWFMP
jgi:menaquinol-cytochrome c reductase cytochrome b/c subunit